MFCKQKGYLEEELDYRKQALDQAYMVSVCLCVVYVCMYYFAGLFTVRLLELSSSSGDKFSDPHKVYNLFWLA